MKKIIAYLVFVLVLVGIISWFYNFSYSFCDQPIEYRVDIVDPKFKLSRDNFLSDIGLAAQIWNNALGKKLFVYNPKGDLSINLIYDERQSLTSQIKQFENNVQSEKLSLNPKISEYQNLSLDFKQKVSSLNKDIEYWNNQGGAPPDEYQKIISKQQELRTEANQLNTMAKSLNVSADAYNLQVSELNQTITSFNDALDQRPEEGVFKGPEDRIEIYLNINREELIHTLAHELGHALGLMHSNNPKAIMYYKTSQSTTVSNDDITALGDICKKHKILELIQNYLSQILIKYLRYS